jgi:hypothetical protein
MLASASKPRSSTIKYLFPLLTCLPLGACGSAQQSSSSCEPAGANVGAAVVPGEYWITGDSLALHVRLTSATEAVVFDGNAAYDFSVQQGAGELAAKPVAATEPGAPSLALRGPVVLRAKQPTSEIAAGIDALAIELEADGSLGSGALVLRAEADEPQCFQGGPRQHRWSVLPSTVAPDTEVTRVSVVPLFESTPLGILPWSQLLFRANKPTGRALQANEQTTANGPTPVQMAWAEDASSTYQAIGTLQNWSSVAGASLAFSGLVTNTNGAGEGGTIDWLELLRVVDFGPSRTGSVDWSQGEPSDLISWGTEVLQDDSRCASESMPAARSCLHIQPGGGLVLRYQGPLNGLRVVAKEELAPSTGPGPSGPALTLTMAPADGAAVESAGNGEHSLLPTSGDVFVVLQLPAAQQTSTTCTQPVGSQVYVDAIEPVAP